MSFFDRFSSYLKPPEFDRQNTSFVTRRTRFESSWWHGRTMRWLGVTSFLKMPARAAGRSGTGNGESRGDLDRRVLVLLRTCRSSPTEEARGSDPRKSGFESLGRYDVDMAIRVRSIGRMRGSGPRDRGSNPWPGATARWCIREHTWPSTRRRGVRDPYALRNNTRTTKAQQCTPREHVRPCTGLLIRETGFESLTRYAIRCRPTEGRLTVTQVIGVRIPASELMGS